MNQLEEPSDANLENTSPAGAEAEGTSGRLENPAAHLGAVVRGYCQLRRIEDFHRIWKGGACDADVAICAERLKLLARARPDDAAGVELTSQEIRALMRWKQRTKKRAEVIPDGSPTVGQAALWISQLGGYTGKSSSGPGAITIGRGLDRLRQQSEALGAPGPSGEEEATP